MNSSSFECFFQNALNFWRRDFVVTGLSRKKTRKNKNINVKNKTGSHINTGIY
jgi:hypothetical protein